MTALWRLSAATIARGVAAGSFTASEVTAAHLARVHLLDASYSAFVETWDERALATAAAIDEDRAMGRPLGPLAGVPVACKDNLVLAGERTSAGSRLLAEFRSPYTATALARLQAAGAVLLGRTNMDEFGMGNTTETSAFGPTRNPFDPSLVPGGSTGGGAAAIAADFCPLAIGSDTGGSVRQPASLCGVMGLKPTYGRVSRSGLVAYASSLDCVGALARTAEDLALWLDVTAGLDAADPTSIAAERPATPQLTARKDLRGLRIGVPREMNGPGLDEEVLAVTRTAAQLARQLGAELVDCSLPAVAHAVATYYLIATAEAASNLARYDGVRFGQRREGHGRLEAMMTRTRSSGFGDEVQLRILLGTFALSYGYAEQFHGRAARMRARLCADFATAFANCDVLLSPTSPMPAFPLGSTHDDPLTLYLCDALTVPASLAGLPAMSQPFGSTHDGRPIGVQWTASHGRETLLLQITHVLQQHSEHHLRRALP